MANPAAKRLQQDLKQLKEEPIVGAMATPGSEKDIMVWYGIVVGTEGTSLAGIPIRFCMEFPNEYPNSAPKAYFETYIKYENGATSFDNKGRQEVCLNIFGNYAASHSDWKSAPSGWSPAYTVSTILLSLQAMVMGGMLSSKVSDVEKMISAALSYTCPETGHDGSDSSKWFPQVINDPAVAAAITEEFRKKNPKPTGLLETFYICYANQQLNGKNSIIGYGVNIENPKNGILSSPCEYLSKESFTGGKIRKSSTNKPFQYWLPILTRTEDWTNGKKIKNEFLTAVNTICEAIKYQDAVHKKVFKVCSSLMNSLVVEIMKNENNSTANDKFINGYFAIFRLLHQYSQDDKLLPTFSNDALKNFTTSSDARVKKNLPNLGEFLMHLTISSEITWAEISTIFMNECETRNVFWYCVNIGRAPYPPHPELADANYKGDRVSKVFNATKVSRNLVMFQIKFANVTNFLDMEEFNSNFGLAPENLKAELKNLYGKVVAVASWNEFYDFVQMPNVTNDEREKQLEEAVKRSAAQGYHKSYLRY